MLFRPADRLSVLAFEVILVVIIWVFLRAGHVVLARAGKRRRYSLVLSVGTFLFIIGFSIFVKSGFVQAQPMPRLMLFFGIINVAALILAFSPFGKLLATHLPLWGLVAFQSFRLPLELVMHSWAEQGTIPETMTWTGQNFDIISGILAVVFAVLARQSAKAAWIFNIIGFALLLNVFRVVILSSPLPFAWPVEPPLQLAFFLPYALIGPVCVGGALAAHLILFRKLLAKKT